MYTAIVRPAISYASIPWWNKTEEVTVQKKLSSVERNACVLITNAIRSTLTRALETMLSFPQLQLFIKKEAKIINYSFSIDENKTIRSYTCKILVQKNKEKMKF